MALPEDMYAKSAADEGRIREFTNSIDRKSGSATLEQILVQVSDIGTDEIKAMETLAESNSTEYENVRSLVSVLMSEKQKEYQKTIRILVDNGWIRSEREDGRLVFSLTDEGYESMDWL